MRVTFTVRDGRGGFGDVDVLLDAPPGTAMRDVVPRIVAALGEEVHPWFAARLQVWVDGCLADPDASVHEAGLREGSLVSLYAHDGPSPALPCGVAEVRVVAGPGAGRVHRLALGRTMVGCGADGFSLPDVRVPGHALCLLTRPDGQVEITVPATLPAGLPLRLDGTPLPDATAAGSDPPNSRGHRGRERRGHADRANADRANAGGANTGGANTGGADAGGAVMWPRGACLRIADTVLQLADPATGDAETTPSADGAGVDFHRPPRLLPAAHQASVTMPAPPPDPPKRAFPWLVVAAPLVLAVPMAVLSSPRFLIFALMSPLMMIANVVNDRRTGRREHRTRLHAYHRELEEARTVRDRLLGEEEHRRRAEAPDPAQVLLTAVGPGRRLWQRRRRDDDYLVLRVGLGDRPARLDVLTPPGAAKPAGVTGDGATASDDGGPVTARDVPVTVDLRRLGVVGLAGDPETVAAEANWLVAQACALHSPRDLKVVLLTDAGPATAHRWGWIRRVPHTRPDDLPTASPAAGDGGSAGRPVVLVGNDQDSIARRVAELSALVAQRLSERTTAAGSRSLTPGPDLLVVLDGARRLRTLPGVAALLRDGPPAGVHLLCLQDTERALPQECQAVLACTPDRLTLRETKADPIPDVTPDAVEPAWTARVARALAPLRDAGPDEEDAALPASVRLLDRLHLDPPSPDAVLDRWRAGGCTAVVVGAGFDGDFRIDLRRDGPHALVAGTTGAGKSEFLQTLVASLAVANPPQALTFVLVDYKGGAAFRECARLPHTVGMVTDLDAHLVTRALESLAAELKRRERLLGDAGAKDLEDYTALRTRASRAQAVATSSGPGARRDRNGGQDLPAIPRLVIVIDEFAGLVAELPDFVPGLVGIAQRGRSLGIHLVLATQRPTGVVSAEIRANTTLRICLRVTDDADSRDVIDAPDAARIPRNAPGRGLARTGHSSLLPFQAGRVGGRRPEPVTGPGRAQAPRQGRAVAQPGEPPLLWALPWDRLGAPAPQRPRTHAIATDEGDTDLSDLVTAIRAAARIAGTPAQPSPWLPPLPDLLQVGDLPEEADGLSGESDAAAARPVSHGGAGSSTDGTLSAGWALLDLPAEQAQRPCRFRLGSSGHLYVVGGPRSGRTTTLRTLIASLARQVPATDLHLYGLDCGNGGLAPLADLPHCGAVVPRTATERADRLIRRLREEVARRQDLLAAGGHADLDEQRATTPPDQRLPYLVLALDRWEGFATTLGELDGGRLVDDIMGLLREGACAGLHVLISGDRSLLLGRIGALVEHKLLLRLPDRNDYALAGLSVRDLPEHLPPGRGLWADTGTETQVAVLSNDLTGTGEAAAVRAIAETATTARTADPAAGTRPGPFRLAALPTVTPARTILDALTAATDLHADSSHATSPLWIPLGIGGDDLNVLGLDLAVSPIAVIAGPPRCGRTTTLRFALAAATRRGARVLAVSPRAGTLTDQAAREQGPTAAFTGTGTDHGQPTQHLIDGLRDLPAGSLVLIDDAEMVRDGDLAPVLLAVTRQAREKSWGVLVAGDTAQLGTGLSGWLYEARRARQGLLLAPRALGDGEVLGVRLAHSHLPTRTTPGRGLLIRPGEEPILIQVPLPDPPDQDRPKEGTR